MKACIRWLTGCKMLWPATFGLVAAAACSGGLTGPSRPAPKLTFAAAYAPNPFSPPPATVQTPTRTSVSVSGTIATPTPCYRITATDQINDTTLIIQLDAFSTTSSGESCASVIGSFDFTVLSQDVPVTISHLRVEQTGAASGFPKVILDTDITRPM